MGARWRFVGVRFRFRRPEEVFKFVALAALVSVIAATCALAALALKQPIGGMELFRNWWTWWQGDATGMIVVAPLILSWAGRGTVRWTRHKILEAVLVALLLVVASRVVFSGGTGGRPAYGTTFLIVPFVVWVAFRFSQREVTTAVAALSAIAIGYTLQLRLGPFSAPPVNEALLLLLVFVSTLAFTGLVLAAVLGQLDEALTELRARQRELEQRFDERTHAQVASWNPGAQRISGYAAEEDVLGERRHHRHTRRHRSAGRLCQSGARLDRAQPRRGCARRSTAC